MTAGVTRHILRNNSTMQAERNSGDDDSGHQQTKGILQFPDASKVGFQPG
jgi:hypothetical protein